MASGVVVPAMPSPREESSEMTAVEGHSDMLFDAATYASEVGRCTLTV